MFYGEPEQKPDEQINERTRTAAATTMTSATTVGLPPPTRANASVANSAAPRTMTDPRIKHRFNRSLAIGNRQSLISIQSADRRPTHSDSRPSAAAIQQAIFPTRATP